MEKQESKNRFSNFSTATTTTKYIQLWDTDSRGKVSRSTVQDTDFDQACSRHYGATTLNALSACISYGVTVCQRRALSSSSFACWLQLYPRYQKIRQKRPCSGDFTSQISTTGQPPAHT